MSHGIIVLGAPRSGTSLVTELIYRWGAYAGAPQDLLAADERNPRGFWEYLRLKEFDSQLLASVGASVRVPPQDGALLAARARQDEYRQPALSLLAGMQGRADAWVWKDPRLTMLLPFWQQLWGQVLYVVTVRQPPDIARSQEKISRSQAPVQFPLSAFYLYWQHLMLSVLGATADAPHKLFLSYEALLRDPQQGVARLCAALDEYAGLSGGAEQRQTAMLEAVNQRLHRNRSETPFAQEPLATREQKRLYSYLLDKIADPDLPFDPEDFPIFPGWHEYLQNMAYLYQFYHQCQSQACSVYEMV